MHEHRLKMDSWAVAPDAEACGQNKDLGDVFEVSVSSAILKDEVVAD